MSFKPLGEIVSVKGGKRLPKGSVLQEEPNSHPYIRVKDMGARYIPRRGLEFVPNDVFPKISRYIVNTNDVIISIVGTIGLISVIDEFFDNASQTENCAKLTGLDKVDALYLYYFLRSEAGQSEIKMGTVGAVQAKLPLYNIEKLSIYWPLREVRQKIVSQLSTIDDKLECNAETNQTLEQIAQAIFKSWFIDFDPVKAKIAALEAGGSDKDAELAAISVISAKTIDELNSLKSSNPEAFNKLAQTAALFPAAMQDSELGEIPDGWEVSEIGNEVTVVGGGTPSTKNSEFWENGTIHWTTPKDMSSLNCKVLTNTDRKITEAGLKKISSGILPENTVLMSSRAPVGYLALAKIPVAINQGYIAMKCENKLSPEYVLLWCEHNMKEIKQRASGTTFAEISKANFKPIPVIVPTQSIVDVFSSQVFELYNFVHSNIQQSNLLSATGDLLLPKLLAGELSVFLKGDE